MQSAPSGGQLSLYYSMFSIDTLKHNYHIFLKSWLVYIINGKAVYYYLKSNKYNIPDSLEPER